MHERTDQRLLPIGSELRTGLASALGDERQAQLRRSREPRRDVFVNTCVLGVPIAVYHPPRRNSGTGSRPIELM